MTHTEELAERTGATYRQVDHWARRGYLRVNSRGHGVLRHWSDEEIRVATVMARLVAAGLTPAAAHTAARGRSRIGPGVYVLVDPEVCRT